MNRLSDYVYILGTIAFTVYGQIIIKSRVVQHGVLPVDTSEKLRFILSLLLDPGILSGLIAGFAASLSWMAAMTKFDLSYAYPFMSLNFVVVLLLSGWLMNEPITTTKILGVALIVIGTTVAARG